MITIKPTNQLTINPTNHQSNNQTMQENNLQDEEVDSILKTLVFLLGLHWLLRYVLVFLNRVLGFHRIAHVVSHGGRKSVNELWKIQVS